MRVIVLVSANAEWRALKEITGVVDMLTTPYGECFTLIVGGEPLIFFHGGWGKIAAAASAQYVIDRWRPELLINLGTCGGFQGRIAAGQVILVERALVYDIIEQMGDSAEAIRHYETRLDLSWLRDPLPHPVRRGLLVSADRDILPADIPMLVEKYNAAAADWESAAIAWVAAKNNTRCLILRGVSDLVDGAGGEAYGNLGLFHDRTRAVMQALFAQLPGWVIHYRQGAGPD